MSGIIFHIDVNSAYLSWSALKKLEEGADCDLRTIPSIIGGDTAKRHGVVLAKSIPAKKFRIRTGEPVVSALRKCPFLVMEPPDHRLYAKRSRQLTDFLTEICPDIEQVSIDECYMDFTSVEDLYPSASFAAAFMKDEIRKRFGYTVNIGISDRKVLAKMASDFKKPDLVHTLFHNEIQEKMWPLPVSSLYMCGHSSVETLKKLEIMTIGDLAQADPDILYAHMKSHGRQLWEYANGIDDSCVITEPERQKGVGNSTTRSKDATTRAEALHPLLQLADSVSRRLRSAGQMAGMINVEIKYGDFSTVSHQTTLTVPTDSSDTIYHTACELFDKIWNHNPIRLLGIRTSKLKDSNEPRQLNLFEISTGKPASQKQQKLDAALDSIRSRYGNSAVVRGSFLEKKTSRPHSDS